LNAFQAFSVVFQKAIEKAVPAEAVSTRVVNLIDCITYSVFMYTSRGLFERDKLIFSSQMAFQASLLFHMKCGIVYYQKLSIIIQIIYILPSSESNTMTMEYVQNSN
jgi:hypothetical protein